MIPVISTQIPVEQQTEKVGFKLTSLYSNLEVLNQLFFGDCNTVKDITDQIPLWIIHEKEQTEEQGQTAITIFDFLQKYYDWLYCDSEKGSGYQLGLSLLDLVDIDKTRDQFVQRLADIYANGIESSAYADNGGKIQTESARNFVHNIRKNFYQKKTTLDGIRYFFKTLFDVPEEQVKIEYPKKYLLRLNGGRFSNSNFYFPGGTGSYELLQTLSGSCLNFSRIQDGNFFQDYSYLLKTGIKSSYYKETYKTLAHPAGLRVIYEKSLEDYSGPQTDYDFTLICERTYLRNYAPYGISYEYTTSIGACGGTTYYGLDVCTGCTGYTGFTAPTHAFPNWNTTTILGYNFKNVVLRDFFDICYDGDEKVSPNIGLTCSTCIEEET
jgi:hypothetical protein